MLAAIYNVWDGIELLRGSMLQLKGHVDYFIIVYQTTSNFGEQYNPLPDIDITGFDNVHLVCYNPEVIKSQRSGMAPNISASGLFSMALSITL